MSNGFRSGVGKTGKSTQKGLSVGKKKPWKKREARDHKKSGILFPRNRRGRTKKTHENEKRPRKSRTQGQNAKNEKRNILQVGPRNWKWGKKERRR